MCKKGKISELRWYSFLEERAAKVLRSVRFYVSAMPSATCRRCFSSTPQSQFTMKWLWLWTQAIWMEESRKCIHWTDVLHNASKLHVVELNQWWDAREFQLVSVLQRLHRYIPVMSRSSCYWLCWRSLIWNFAWFLFTCFYLFYHVFITLLFWWPFCSSLLYFLKPRFLEYLLLK